MARQPLINGKTGVGVTLQSTTGLCILRPVYLNGVNENSFHILPSNFLCTDWPRIRGEALTYEQYSTYGTEWFSRSCLLFLAETKTVCYGSLHCSHYAHKSA